MIALLNAVVLLLLLSDSCAERLAVRPVEVEVEKDSKNGLSFSTDSEPDDSEDAFGPRQLLQAPAAPGGYGVSPQGYYYSPDLPGAPGIAGAPGSAPSTKRKKKKPKKRRSKKKKSPKKKKKKKGSKKSPKKKSSKRKSPSKKSRPSKKKKSPSKKKGPSKKRSPPRSKSGKQG